MAARRNRAHQSTTRDDRRDHFDPEHQPFRDEQALELDDESTDGALRSMNPTRATFDVHADHAHSQNGHANHPNGDGQRPSVQSRERSDSDVQYKWTSRDNRKGRHPLQINGPLASYVGNVSCATSLSSVLKGIQRMASTLSSDISYLGATAMTAACVFLVTNAILSFLPYANPNFQPPDWITALEGVLTLVGCALFLTSSTLSFLEAVNQDQRGCFGWKQENATDEGSSQAVESDSATLVPDWCKISRRNSIVNLFRNSGNNGNNSGESAPLLGKPNRESRNSSWRFFPTMYELRHHFLYDIGFVACSILLISSIVYCACAAAALITILTTGSIIPWIRIPQVIASLGFMASSALFMVETQEEWWRPQYNAIGWWISFLNFVGAAGFALSAFFPLHSSESWAQYQLSTNFFWGSWGFFIGSILQWYESLDKNPVYEAEEGE